MMEQISKNCYKGFLITDPTEIERLALEKRTVYCKNLGMKPAAFLLSMHFRYVMRMINDRMLWYVINNSNEKSIHSNN